mmetsp:Transcript_24978/g.42799  ORF Transcript_24978/g.42799 Transcript_24978/m.42799 type:complete len:476 (-) Transcript_24978:144-1571(-)
MEVNGDELEYLAAFGGNGASNRISRPCKERINRIKNNDPGFIDFVLQSGVANHFSDLAWKLIGRYIAENEYLKSILMRTRLLDDAKMSIFFNELSRGNSVALKKLELIKADFGINGIRSMVRYLKKSNLTVLEISHNESINTVCFELLLGSLSGGCIESLRLRCCDIDSIAAFENCTLPHLRLLNIDQNKIHSIPSFRTCKNLEHLSLEGNWIGRRGYSSVAKLLQEENPPVRYLDLTFTGMRDAEAELVASSLKQNTSLNHLRLEGNKIKEEGRRAFLELLNDASSIKSTCSSNHSIRLLELPRSFDLNVVRMFNHIDFAIQINKENAEDPQAASRMKVIDTQLHSNTRMELSGLQLLEYYYSSLFPQIEPLLLPNILSMMGEYHGQSELYRMLIATVPELVSIVNKKAALQQRLSDNVSRMDAINTEYAHQAATLLADYERQLADLTAEKNNRAAALHAENLDLQKELESIEK